MTYLKSAWGWLLAILQDAAKVTISLYKILIPVIILVKILSELGAVKLIGKLLSPLMGLVGLPGETGLVWATAIFTNIYGAIATLLLIYPTDFLSVQQMTVLSTMILVCHALPVELALCEKVGASFRLLAPLRFIGAFLLAFILHHSYSYFGDHNGTAIINWVAQNPELHFSDWLINQTKNLLFVPCVLTALLVMMRLFDLLGINRLLAYLLQPILRLLGISKQASNIAIFGLLAGITFGSGLLLAEARKNSIAPRDVVLVLAFLSLCHGLIEDTTLMLLMGADLHGILWGRIAFSLLVITLFSKLPNRIVESFRTGRSLI